MPPRDEVNGLYVNATVFCCPSVCESFGIINLEAMACGTPAVDADLSPSDGRHPSPSRFGSTLVLERNRDTRTIEASTSPAP